MLFTASWLANGGSAHSWQPERGVDNRKNRPKRARKSWKWSYHAKSLLTYTKQVSPSSMINFNTDKNTEPLVVCVFKFKLNGRILEHECTRSSQSRRLDTNRPSSCGYLMTLYGIVGVQQLARALVATVQSSGITAVARASQHSNRMPEYATLLTFPSTQAHSTVFLHDFTSRNRQNRVKSPPMSIVGKTRARNVRKTRPVFEWKSLTQLWRSNIWQHTAPLCL